MSVRQCSAWEGRQVCPLRSHAECVPVETQRPGRLVAPCLWVALNLGAPECATAWSMHRDTGRLDWRLEHLLGGELDRLRWPELPEDVLLADEDLEEELWPRYSSKSFLTMGIMKAMADDRRLVSVVVPKELTCAFQREQRRLMPQPLPAPLFKRLDFRP